MLDAVEHDVAMDDDNPAGGWPGGELTLTVTDAGVLVTGRPVDVSRYVTSLRSAPGLMERPFASNLSDSLAAATALKAMAEPAGEFVQLTQRSLELLEEFGAIPGRDTPGSFRAFVKDGRDFAGNLEFSKVSLRPNQAAAMQLAAATVALKVAIADVQRAVERVEGKIDGLVTSANARVLGEVVAHNALLTELTGTLDRTGHLPETDWQVVASLGIAVPVAIEQLRQTALLRVGELDGRGDAAERARTLRTIVGSGELRRALTLLVVAQDSYYRWQRVRLEHARTVDPDHVMDMAERATAQLAADMRADQELIELLDAKLVEYATPRPLERLHPIVTRNLAEQAGELHDDLTAFAEARRAQVGVWERPARPSWADAAGEIRSRAARAGQQAAGAGQAAGLAVVASAKDANHHVGEWVGRRGRSAVKLLPKLGRDAPQLENRAPDAETDDDQHSS